jgi:hypothetical protein
MNINQLRMFSAGSANDEYNLHLWLKGASLIIGQFKELINKMDSDYLLEIIDISSFINNNSDRLGSILEQNNSDKSTRHDYHHLYSYILNELDTEPLRIFEIGIGTTDTTLVSSMGITGRPGASLYSFREYLPNAYIYGADIDRNILFTDERIKTCYVDQLDKTSFDNVKKTFGDIEYDLIIDDGLHSIGANFNTLLFALDNIKINGWIVIEDIHISENWHSINYILSKNPKYKTYLVKARVSYLYCVKRLS